MKKTAASFLLATLLPLFVSAATTDELVAQLQGILTKLTTLKSLLQPASTTPAVEVASVKKPAAPSCAPTRALAVGSSGTDVLTLQKLLINDGYLLSDNATGFFGSATERGLKEWQVAYKVVSSGTATSTGWGAVGPKTRAAMAKLCTAPDGSNPGSWATNGPPRTTATSSTQKPLPPASVGQTIIACTSAPQPKTSCTTSWQAVMQGDCVASWQCAAASAAGTSAASANKPPLIEHISGPTLVNVGDTSLWSITASDPEGAKLSYSVSWGDSDSAFTQLLELARVFAQNSDFSHVYTTPGVYTVQVTVVDDLGNTTVNQFSVSVLTPATNASAPTLPASSTAPATYWCPIGILGYWSATPCPTAASGTVGFQTKELPLSVDTSTQCFYNTANYPYGATISSGGQTLMCAGGGWIPSTLGGGAQHGYECTGYGGIRYTSEFPCGSGVNPNANATSLCVKSGQTYQDGALVYGNPCPAAGGACGAVAGPQLQCKSGTWYYTASTKSVCDSSDQSVLSWVSLPEPSRGNVVTYLKSLGCSL